VALLRLGSYPGEYDAERRAVWDGVRWVSSLGGTCQNQQSAYAQQAQLQQLAMNQAYGSGLNAALVLPPEDDLTLLLLGD